MSWLVALEARFQKFQKRSKCCFRGHPPSGVQKGPHLSGFYGPTQLSPQPPSFGAPSPPPPPNRNPKSTKRELSYRLHAPGLLHPAPPPAGPVLHFFSARRRVTPAPLQTNVTLVGNNENLQSQKSDPPFLVHNVLPPPPPPHRANHQGLVPTPPPPPLGCHGCGGGHPGKVTRQWVQRGVLVVAQGLKRPTPRFNAAHAAAKNTQEHCNPWAPCGSEQSTEAHVQRVARVNPPPPLSKWPRCSPSPLPPL